MRIAHFVQRYPPALGGSETYFARLSRYLVERSDQVTVFTTNGLDLEAFWSMRARTLKPGREWIDGVEVRRHALLRIPWQRLVLKTLSLIPHNSWRARRIGSSSRQKASVRCCSIAASRRRSWCYKGWASMSRRVPAAIG